ncbi:MAG: hypothetical protein KTR20_02665 [Cellvibrionaceae bacterium]|nr:hypothetical protein [Cellvibrionaceae bacterium]
MTKINNIFQIIGVLATVFSAYIAYLTLESDTEFSDVGAIDVIKLKVADVVAPEGYTLNNPKISVIERNSHIVVQEADVAYLFRKEKFPFSVKKAYTDRLSLLINGTTMTVRLGDTINILDTDCIFWLYSIESKNYSLELRCGQA